MKKRYDALLNRTGVSGDLSDVDKQVLRVMNEDKDISAEVVGSSSQKKVQITGNTYGHHTQLLPPANVL